MAFDFQPPQQLSAVERRRRYLPHWEQPGCTYFLTWRMADSVPESVLRPWLKERSLFLAAHPKPWDTATQKTYNTRFTRRMEEWLDAGHGSCVLKTPEARDIVERCLRFHEGQRYDLNAWVIMPNHVHVLVKPLSAGPVHESDTDSPVCSLNELSTKSQRLRIWYERVLGGAKSWAFWRVNRQAAKPRSECLYHFPCTLTSPRPSPDARWDASRSIS